MERWIKVITGSLCLLLAAGLSVWKANPPKAQPEPDSLSRPILDPLTAKTLPELARLALNHYFATGSLLELSGDVDPAWQQSRGVFVTLSRNGKTQGCWGSLEAMAPDLAQATIRAAIGAATRDWRYPPIKAADLPQISIQVALVRSVSPVRSMNQVDPTRSGLWIRSGTRGAVLLPGEALTTGWQLSTARRLAGIGETDPVQLFRVEADLQHEFRQSTQIK